MSFKISEQSSTKGFRYVVRLPLYSQGFKFRLVTRWTKFWSMSMHTILAVVYKFHLLCVLDSGRDATLDNVTCINQHCGMEPL